MQRRAFNFALTTIETIRYGTVELLKLKTTCNDKNVKICLLITISLIEKEITNSALLKLRSNEENV